MRTAISVPDDLFDVADSLADRLGVSRNELYAGAGFARFWGVVLTSNVRLLDAAGNVLLPAVSTGLPKDSVANVTQIVTLDIDFLADRTGRVPANLMVQVDAGLTLVLDLWLARHTRRRRGPMVNIVLEAAVAGESQEEGRR